MENEAVTVLLDRPFVVFLLGVVVQIPEPLLLPWQCGVFWISLCVGRQWENLEIFHAVNEKNIDRVKKISVCRGKNCLNLC